MINKMLFLATGSNDKASGNGMKDFMNGIYTFVTSYKDLVYMLVASALVIIGIMFIIPSEKSKESAKSALPWVLVGCGIVLGATMLANQMSNSFSFMS